MLQNRFLRSAVVVPVLTYRDMGEALAFGNAPFGRVRSVVGDTSFSFSDGVQYQVTEYAMNGRPAYHAYRQFPAAVTAAHIAAFKRVFEQQDESLGPPAQKVAGELHPLVQPSE